MAGRASVLASRDGDQFHYHWAARRCLELLPGGSDLVAVAIEGASTSEGDTIEAGEEIIDVGFYFGAEDRKSARRVDYTQLKHSTVHASDPWTGSGLKGTLQGFAKRYRDLVDELSADEVAARFCFRFTTNRPIQGDVLETLADLAAGATPRHPTIHTLLLGYVGGDPYEASRFFALFSAEGGEDNLWAQRNLLTQDVRAYLPDADFDAPVQLKELVTRKATTEFIANPSIRRNDVLRALGATEDDLAPAPNMIAEPDQELVREQEAAILAQLLAATTPLIIHAEGGVGKSVLAARLSRAMPDGSVAVLYDCYGNGLYRMSLNARHRPRDALVQIANELAAQGLCHPLIPSSGADAKAYLRAFIYRLKQAIAVLQARTPGASLCLIIDAADNAQMAAEDLSEARSFVQELIRAPMPAGVRLAFTCRTHRQGKLAPPAEAVAVELQPFSPIETAAHLRGVYPLASDAEVAEFAVLSSDNPRVQATAMSRRLPLPDMLKELGPTPTTVDRMLGDLLDRAIAKLKEEHGSVEAARIDRVCEALAVLRPLVPIAVVARLADMSESEVRSFALDLGRPLFVKGGSLHFLDEPAETWFRERFKPDAAAMGNLLARLQPLSAESSYAAAVLPELLLQAGRLDELVALALSDEGLPSEPIARRDVELQRLIFALKACLQQKRALPAAKLALKAAGETAGDQRQTQLIQDNTDIAAALLTPDRIEELVARRPFGSGWMGSHHAYDAGLLSGRAELAPEASSRLRMAMSWFESWANATRTEDEEEREEVSDADRVELAMALLRVRGAGPAASFLRRWRWRRHAMVAGIGLGRRLFDVGRADQVDDMAIAASNDLWLLLGLASAARSVGHRLPDAVLSRMIRLLGDRRVHLSDTQDLHYRWQLLAAVTSAVEMSLISRVATAEKASQILQRYLPPAPPHDMTSRYGTDRMPLLRAYALSAALRGSAVTLIEIAPERARAQLESGRSYGRDHETEVFEHEIGNLLSWFILSAEVICGRTPANLEEAIQAARKATASAENRLYDQVASSWQMAASCWFTVLQDAGAQGAALQPAFSEWATDPKAKLWPDTMIDLCRRAARAEGLAELAVTLAGQAFEALERGREDAETRLADFTKLARAILPVSGSEAAAVFDRAVSFASRIGEENLDRWEAFLSLGRAASDPSQPKPKTAHRFSRAAELTYEYVVRDKHFAWNSTSEVLAGLCRSSAFAVLSRWRDRGFGHAPRLLPIVVNRLVAEAALPNFAPVALAGVDAEWSRLEILKAAADGEATAHRDAILQLAWRYMRVEPYGHRTWAEVSALGQRLGISFPDAERLAAATIPLSPSRPAPSSERAPPSDASIATRRNPDWPVIFDGIDLTDSLGLRTAYAALRTYDPPYRLEEFFQQALTRAGPGREADLIRAVAGWPDFDTYDLRYLLDALPKPLPRRPALRAAVRETVLGMCRREPERVWRRGWNGVIPFERLEAEGLFTDAEVVSATVEGFAAHVDHLSAGSLFRAVDSLAAMLTAAEADDALNYGMDLVEDLLGPDDADGTWRPTLEPPADTLAALGGYIWAGLGSPLASVRWQFAHAVRGVIELGWKDLLVAILAWAERDDAGPFTDQGLEFYLWHARQWLAIGLARAALAAPAAMETAAPLLRAWTALPHVLIRELCAQALANLAAAGVIDEEDTEGLAAVNRPQKPVRRISGWVDRKFDEVEPAEDSASDDEKYYFGIDIGPYWFRPLGDAFGVTEGAIERRARTAVRDRIGWKRGSWRDDARLTRKIFRDRANTHSHGSLPRADDLRAYHGYHAMMMVAADLLESHVVHQREDDDQNSFEGWLEPYRLTPPDGRWLADRRDPRFTPDPLKSTYEKMKTWRWDVSRADLDAQLTTDDGQRVVWGYWHQQMDDLTETISVRSALVTAVTAESLLVALQTAPDAARYVLPDADQGDDLDVGLFRCTGWIHDHARSRHLDEYDPWSEGMRFPAPTLSDAVISELSMVEDPDGRVWRGPGGAELRGETWTQSVGYGRETDILPGWRLAANSGFLEQLFVARPDERLILHVSVRRNGSRHAGDREDFEEYAWPYELYYLMGADGVAHPF
ncbi:NACHT domain-containing protein [Phenylobacterium sp.]|uniref:NACHT domain-containing protein n=1 Tax=Phenylobacterium sp. TaxID=1871053 RepID=UPI002FE2BFA1